MSCPAAVSFLVHSTPDRSNHLIGRIQLNWKVIMTQHYLRLLTLQDYCFRTNKRRWAKAIGEELKAFLLDNPTFRKY